MNLEDIHGQVAHVLLSFCCHNLAQYPLVWYIIVRAFKFSLSVMQ